MNRRFDSLAIDISDRCNLRCAYCFEKAAGAYRIRPVNPEKLFEGVDFFLNNLIPPEAETLHFHFGRREPLLNFSLLSDMVKYLRKKGDSMSFNAVFHLTTNGTCLDSRIISLLKKHAFDLRISLDGVQEIHDKNRKFKSGDGSFASIKNNIRVLRLEDVPFTVNAVYSPGTSFLEILHFFREHDIERVDFFPLWVRDDSPVWSQNKTDFNGAVQEISQWTDNLIAQLLGDNTFEGVRMVLMEKFLQHLFGFRSSPYYCGAGRNYIGVSSNGRLYPCLKFINLTGWSLGDLPVGIDSRRIDEYLKIAAPSVTESNVCRNCSIADACKGLCYLDKLDLGNCKNSFDFYCAFNKALFDAASRLYTSLKDLQPEALVRLANLENVVDALL